MDIITLSELDPFQIRQVQALLKTKAPLDDCTESVEVRRHRDSYDSVRVTPDVKAQIEAVLR